MGAPETVALSAPTTQASPMLVASDVHVRYRVYEDRRPRISEVIAQRGKRVEKEVHALRGVSFVVHPGEVVGVVGRNGSGKSTLMQALAGVLPVSSGSVRARSRPALLGVGAALNPNLSGRRNITIGGLALALPRQRIEDLAPSIIEFAGLEDAIDRPMRTYSSGMRARLQFSIATAVIPEILLLDEALAVGDKEFKERSKERILELKEAAGVVFLVSHSLSEITRSATRVLWIDHGEVVLDGEPKDVVSAYKKSV